MKFGEPQRRVNEKSVNSERTLEIRSLGPEVGVSVTREEVQKLQLPEPSYHASTIRDYVIPTEGKEGLIPDPFQALRFFKSKDKCERIAKPRTSEAHQVEENNVEGSEREKKLPPPLDEELYLENNVNVNKNTVKCKNECKKSDESVNEILVSKVKLDVRLNKTDESVCPYFNSAHPKGKFSLSHLAKCISVQTEFSSWHANILSAGLFNFFQNFPPVKWFVENSARTKVLRALSEVASSIWRKSHLPAIRETKHGSRELKQEIFFVKGTPVIEKLLVTLQINGVEVTGLLDTGASVSLLTEQDQIRIGLQDFTDCENLQKITDAQGKVIPQKGTMVLKVCTNRFCIMHPFVLIQSTPPHQSIFGLDLLRSLEASIVLKPSGYQLLLGQSTKPTEIIQVETPIFSMYETAQNIEQIDLEPGEKKKFLFSVDCEQQSTLLKSLMTLHMYEHFPGRWPVKLVTNFVDFHGGPLLLELESRVSFRVQLPEGLLLIKYDIPYSEGNHQVVHQVNLIERGTNKLLEKIRPIDRLMGVEGATDFVSQVEVNVEKNQQNEGLDNEPLGFLPGNRKVGEGVARSCFSKNEDSSRVSLRANKQSPEEKLFTTDNCNSPREEGRFTVTRTQETGVVTEPMGASANPSMENEEPQFLHIEDDPSLEPPGVNHPDNKVEFDFPKYLREQSDFPSAYLEDFIRYIEAETPGVISKHEYDIGKFDRDFEMDIEVDPVCPIVQRPYQLNPVQAQQLTYGLDKLCEYGILKEGDSPWVSPAFLIKRNPSYPGGPRRTRIIIDYRKVNKVTVKQHWPMPDIPRLLQQVSGYKYYSKLDLSSAFYCIRMSERAQKVASIITQNKVYNCLRMGFGLSNAPSIFSRSVSMVFNGVPNVSFFQDDIIIHTHTREHHLEVLKKVFKLISEAGFKVNGKGEYFMKKLTFLGKIISASGMQPLTRHVAAMKNYVRPSSIKSLQAFLGLVAWLQGFLPYYSQQIEPLCWILRQKGAFVWGEEQERAFQVLRTSITEKTHLYFPLFDQPLYCIVDASDTSYSGILYQVHSFSPNDVEALREIKQNINAHPKSSVTTKHPVVPPGGGHVPQPIHLQANLIAAIPQTEKEGEGGQVVLTRPVEDETGKITGIEEERKNTPDKGEENGSSELATDFSSARKPGKQDRVSKIPKGLTESVNDGNVHVVRTIAFSSGLFKGPASRYSIMEKEATAMIHSLENFKQYSEACQAETFVLSDSAAFLWLLLSRNLAGKLNRLSAKLLSFNFKIIVQHVRGIYNMADAFTRLYVAKKPDITTFQYRNAEIIHNPFKPGSIITLDDILKYADENPQVIKFPEHEKIPRTKGKDKEKIVSQISGDMAGSHRNETPKQLLLTSDQADIEVVKRQISLVFHIESFDPVQSQLRGELTFDKILREQTKDRKIRPIYIALREGQANKKYIYESGLVKTWKDGRKLILLPESLIGYAVAFFHITNHSGARVITKMIQSSFYYPNMEQIVSQFTSNCHICLKQSPKHDKKVPLGRDPPIREKGRIFVTDVVNGMEPKVQGKDSFLTFCDQATGYVVAVACSNTLSGETAARIFEERILLHFGGNGVLGVKSDNGSNLVKSAAFRKILTKWKVTPYNYTPYAAKTHGMIESRQRIILELLRGLCDTFGGNWYQHLNLVCYQLNATPSRNKPSPFKCMYGHDHSSLTENVGENFQSDEEHLAMIQKVDQDLKRIMLEEEEKFRNKSVQPKTWVRGTVVYIRRNGMNPNAKYLQKFISAPCIIVEDTGQAVLAKTFEGKILRVHKDDIRLCPPRAKENYDKLPLSVKQLMGFSYTDEEILLACELGQVPPFWQETEPAFTRPITRAERRRLNAEEALQGSLYEIPDVEFEDNLTAPVYENDEELESDDDDDDEEEANNFGKKVTFNV